MTNVKNQKSNLVYVASKRKKKKRNIVYTYVDTDARITASDAPLERPKNKVQIDITLTSKRLLNKFSKRMK